MPNKSWIQCPITYRLIPRDEYVRAKTSSHHIMEDIKPFVSPIDGTIISSRPKLEAHNKRHGVTNSADYSQAHFDKAAARRQAVIQGNTPEAKRERIETIQRAMHQHNQR